MKKVILASLLLVLNLSAFSLFGSSENELKKVDYMNELKNLIVSTQKTRGLTNNYMNGNVVAMLLVFSERKEMKKSLHALKKFSELDNSTLVLEKKLISLNKIAFKQNAHKSFTQYTALIEKMLVIGDAFVMNKMKDNSDLSKNASRMMMNNILPFTENIGKIRGLGSGIVARTYSKKTEDKQLQSFVNTVENLNEREAPNMKVLAFKYPQYYPENVADKIEEVSTETRKYIALTQTNVIGQKDIKLNTNAYFNQGTDLISKALELFDENADAMRKEISN